MITSRDQLGRAVQLASVPIRIVSLVPSQTELLFDLGLEGQIAGVTKFCVHPKEMSKDIRVVGGTKNPSMEKIRMLKPDLILANKEENRREDIEMLEEDFPVWISDVNDLGSACDLILSVGEMTDTSERATAIVEGIKTSFRRLSVDLKHRNQRKKKVVYLIWNDPVMAAGNNTFIDSMLTECGFENCIAGAGYNRYPELIGEHLIALNPDVVMLSSEPFPFGEKHITYFQNLLPLSQVIKVDGEMFSWYGSRLIKSAHYFQQLITEIYSSNIERN